MSSFELSILLFVQFAVILGSCRLVGWLIRPLGQPQVMAEMMTGILLGPSLFGWLAPGLQARLFPPQSLPVLYCLAQIGLVLYMFLIGLEFDLGLLKQKARSAAFVSWAGILAPLLLGAVAVWALRDRVPLFAAHVEPWVAMLFMGSAMAITAFPVLARIIAERGLTGSALGTLALASGAVNDAVAWCLLAIVLAGFTGQTSIAVLAIGGGIAYALLMFFAGRPLLVRLYARLQAAPKSSNLPLAVTLILLMLASWFTDRIGIYAVFGAFVLGAVMPRGELQRQTEAQIGPLTTVFLVPIFFINSGLHTSIALLSSPAILAVAVLLLLVATAGKGLACALAARLSGETMRDAFAIGALMNARGLMELILLNIGYERGVITQTLFTMLVLMALATTFMAVPLFNRVYRAGVLPPP
ncbi:MAG: cation:proton antiporter [Thermoanaerobaculia bacterium]